MKRANRALHLKRTYKSPTTSLEGMNIRRLRGPEANRDYLRRSYLPYDLSRPRPQQGTISGGAGPFRESVVSKICLPAILELPNPPSPRLIEQ